MTQAVGELLAADGDERVPRQRELRELATTVLKTALKDVVQEAVREVEAESTARAQRRRGRDVVCFGLGLAVGYLAAYRRPSIGDDVLSREPFTRFGNIERRGD